MSKSLQFMTILFIICISAVVLYFGNETLTKINIQEAKIQKLEQNVATYRNVINLVKDLGATLKKDDLPPKLQVAKENNVTLRAIEGRYCNSASSQGSLVLHFSAPSKVFIWSLEEGSSAIDGQAPHITGDYFIFSPYIYVTIPENGIRVNRRLTVLKIDERGYIRQFSIGEKVFANGLCPSGIRDSY